jgi:hypothetical protein
MIQQLTKQEDAIYTQLVKEYNKGNYQKVCSLDRFLKNKWENEKNESKAAIYYQIWFFACEDF